ncbi:MAG: DNA repair protein RecN [Crocinitomicaceae bacterium]|nr:DNA repair protein RecN [Crocinitomicaceae bacterium]
MLQQLHVSNYALIDKITVDFHSGLTAITGETGSGKSILLGAFGFLLGGRADSRSIKNPAAKCIVEALFELKEYGLQTFFGENDLDYEDQTTIRREIAPGGKSRCFINDTPVSLNTLKMLGELLVDIHSQHQNSILGERSFQFSTVDGFAKNKNYTDDYRTAFKKYREYKKDLETCLEEESRIRQEMDYLQFQWNELQKAELEKINLTELEKELELLNNAGLIKNTLQHISSLFDGDGQSVLSGLTSARQSLQKIAPYNNELEEFANRSESCLIELKELAREIDLFGINVQMDEQRIENLNERLGKVYQLLHKHHVKSMEELKGVYAAIDEKITGYSGIDDKIKKLKESVKKEEENLHHISEAITETRKKAAVKLQKEVEKYFSELHLDHAELNVEITPSDDYNTFGKDNICFLFKANKGGNLLPVQQVASGGEISRVMLAIKASISHHKKLPVLILDEIDQGVSGETGKKIGTILKEMSGDIQVLTITHLPQIAGKAQHHLKVFKVVNTSTASTSVKELSNEERIRELAEMLNGKSYTAAALQNAKELLN